MPTRFPCYLVRKDADGQVHASVAEKTTDDLPPGDVLIQVAWSSLNYKDGLSASGHMGVTKKYPHVPGIDAVGTVAACDSGQFRPGDAVVVTGFDLGQNTWGGFAGYLRVPATWVLPLPEGLASRESMILGTAGLTAGLCIDALIHRGLDPSQGEVVVTGSSGGVGCLAVAILARLGYQVVAVSGKPAAHDFLRRLGATRVVPREEVCDTSAKPLLPIRWAGAVDAVGGATLATLVRSTRLNGTVAACGLVGGTDLPLTVYPFLLRGIDLVGIDSAQCPLATRQRIWTQLAGPWRPAALDALAEEIPFSQLGDRIAKILAGQIQGRVVVKPVA